MFLSAVAFVFSSRTELIYTAQIAQELFGVGLYHDLFFNGQR
jgi:hypothetical protein